MKDFDPTKILKVQIDKVEPNDYNPKEKDTPEYRNVVKSIQLNGLKQPIFVREVDGNDNFVIVDGEQRWTAANELGYKEIYIYNLGKISEEEANKIAEVRKTIKDKMTDKSISSDTWRNIQKAAKELLSKSREHAHPVQSEGESLPADRQSAPPEAAPPPPGQEAPWDG